MQEGAEPLLPELYAGEGFDAEQASCMVVPTHSLPLQANWSNPSRSSTHIVLQNLNCMCV